MCYHFKKKHIVRKILNSLIHFIKFNVFHSIIYRDRSVVLENNFNLFSRKKNRKGGGFVDDIT